MGGSGRRARSCGNLAKDVLGPRASPIPWPGTAPTPLPIPLAGMKGRDAKGAGWDTRLMPARGDAGASQACPRHGRAPSTADRQVPVRAQQLRLLPDSSTCQRVPHKLLGVCSPRVKPRSQQDLAGGCGLLCAKFPPRGARLLSLGWILIILHFLPLWMGRVVRAKPPMTPAPSTAPVSRLAAGSVPTGGCWPLPSRSSRAVGRRLRSQLPHWPGFPLSSPKFTWLDTKQPFGSPSWGSPTAASSGCLLHEDLAAPVLGGDTVGDVEGPGCTQGCWH